MVKIGIIGVGGIVQGVHIPGLKAATGGKIVAICDKWEEALKSHQEAWQDENITYYTDFDEFIKHDMDAVILAFF